MNQKSKALSRRKFIGDAAAISAMGALGDLYPHRLESCRATLLERQGLEVPDQNCFTGFDSYK